MTLFELLIPVADNAGVRFSKSHHATFEGVVRNLAGGLSKCAPIEGQWVSEGKLYAEKMTPLRVVTTPSKMLRLAKYAKTHYAQLAILFYPLSSGATFV